MAISNKRKGPLPNVPSHWERWQVLAVQSERLTDAISALRTRHPQLTLIECTRRVQAFHREHQGRYKV